MPDLQDGESIKVQGSGSKPYELKNTGGVFSCTCPAWRNQSLGIEKRTCKHLRALRGEAAEEARVGGALPARPKEKADAALAAPVLLAESWDGVGDVTGWWMSEKLDGVRAYWNGKEFISRLGNPFYAPDWFLAGLPSEPLDGELWVARKAFQRTSGMVRRQDKSDLWKEIRYLVFDAPGVEEEFERRMEVVQDLVKNLPYASAHSHTLCQGVDHLREELARVESIGGEGLMLRQPNSRYAVGRSTTLLKVKSFKDDEAKVIGHQAGLGRHKGRVGALLVEMTNGIQFAVGTGLSDAERENPPPVGSIITFRYQELSDAGVPRFPSYLRLYEEGPAAAPGLDNSPQVSQPDSKMGAAAELLSSTTGTSTAATSTAGTSTEPTLIKSASTAPDTIERISTAPTLTTTEGGAAPSGSSISRFQLVDGSSDKFWEVSVTGKDVTVRYGRNGTSGQTNTKSFADESAAAAYAEKLIKEKTGKGYQEVG